ncbi:protein yellow-like isoform X2 [Cimex lectularius]|nr:protein yellow-like isoform X2 [Cimex lectularius]XP_014247792.1 protein yellow-like isoform X2 [Cimex lectularius]
MSSLPLLLLGLSYVAGELEIMYQWTLAKFDTPFNYPPNTKYRADTTFINSVEVGWDRVFVTLPRIWSGNPASLAWVPRPRKGQPNDPSPPLQAYPGWEWHVEAASRNLTKGNCSGLVSVFRARLDRCNRLWVLDSGVQDSLVTFNVVCPPRIFIFDLRTDQLVRMITLPNEVLRRNTLLSNMVLDDQSDFQNGGYGSCDNMFVYMSDTVAPAIVVYDSTRDAAWRLQHPKMYPDPDYGTYTLAGESFTLMDGILGMALNPAGSYRRTLFFQPFASDRLFGVPTSALQRGPNPGDDAELPVTLVGHKSSQAAGLAVDIRDGSLVFCPVSETAIAAWQPGSLDHKVVAYSPELLQFVLDFRSADRDEGNMWLVSSRFHKYFRRTVNPKEFNIRIMRLTPEVNHLNSTLFVFKK